MQLLVALPVPVTPQDVLLKPRLGVFFELWSCEHMLPLCALLVILELKCQEAVLGVDEWLVNVQRGIASTLMSTSS